jgi:hypothetical protein
VLLKKIITKLGVANSASFHPNNKSKHAALPPPAALNFPRKTKVLTL